MLNLRLFDRVKIVNTDSDLDGIVGTVVGCFGNSIDISNEEGDILLIRIGRDGDIRGYNNTITLSNSCVENP